MRAVLSDLALESESAMFMWLRLASALDRAGEGDAHEAAFVRLATAIAKYWVCKRAPSVAYEAMEAHGGNGWASLLTAPQPRPTTRLSRVYVYTITALFLFEITTHETISCVCPQICRRVAAGCTVSASTAEFYLGRMLLS
jgi:hypothetical protein